MNKIAIVLVILLIGGSTYVFQEAEAINKIVGYVSEAKAKALAEANKTGSAISEEEVEEFCGGNIETCFNIPDEDTVNRSDDIDVVETIKSLLGLGEEEEEAPKRFTKIVGIQLSKTCLQMERHNVTSKCPTYKDLMMLDNTISDISGNVTLSDDYWHREFPDYKNHCNWYLDKYPVIIVVDPDNCWQRYTGIRMITIQALDPEKMVFKLQYDRDVIDELQDLREEERELYDDKNQAEKNVDSLEDQIDDLERDIRNLEDDVDKPRCDKDKISEACNSSLQSRNAKFQLRFAEKKLVDKEQDLLDEEFDFMNATRWLNTTRVGKEIIQTSFSSRLSVDGTSSMGVGRYVEECRNATIGSNMTLVMDTLNYLLFDCDPEKTNFDSVKTQVKEQTPLYIGNFTEYKYKAWLAEAKERCKEKCNDY